MAHFAIFYFGLKLANGFGEAGHIGIVLTKHPKNEAQCCLTAYPRELGKLLDCLFQ
jgi:hypothetical protein